MADAEAVAAIAEVRVLARVRRPGEGRDDVGDPRRGRQRRGRVQDQERQNLPC